MTARDDVFNVIQASRCDSQRRTSPERKRHKHGQDQPAEPYLNDKAAHVAAAANGILHKAGSFSAEANGAQQTAGASPVTEILTILQSTREVIPLQYKETVCMS